MINNNTNILFVGNHTFSYNKFSKENYYKGGIEVFNDSLLKFFAKFNSNIDYLVCSYLLDRNYKELFVKYINYYKLNKVEKWDNFNIDQIKNYVISNKIDLIVYSTSLRKGIDYPVNYLIETGIPILIFLHGGLNVECINELLVKNKNYYIVASVNREYNSLIERGFNNDQFSLVDYPALLDITKVNTDDHKLSDGLLLNSRWDYQKGILNAFKLSKSLNSKLICIGRKPTGNYTKFLENEVIGYNYEYLGVQSRNNIQELIGKSAFSISLPNELEASCLSVRESLLLGTPVITWNDYNFPYYVPKDECILLEHTNNFIDEFNEIYLPKIEKYLSSDNRRKVFNYAKLRFSEESFYNNLKNILLKLGV